MQQRDLGSRPFRQSGLEIRHNSRKIHSSTIFDRHVPGKVVKIFCNDKIAEVMLIVIPETLEIHSEKKIFKWQRKTEFFRHSLMDQPLFNFSFFIFSGEKSSTTTVRLAIVSWKDETRCRNRPCDGARQTGGDCGSWIPRYRQSRIRGIYKIIQKVPPGPRPRRRMGTYPETTRHCRKIFLNFS